MPNKFQSVGDQPRSVVPVGEEVTTNQSSPSSTSLPMTGSTVLSLNAGSSSLKFALFSVGQSLSRELLGSVSRIGLPESELKLCFESTGVQTTQSCEVADHALALDLVVKQIREAGVGRSIAAVGHRILHGGESYHAPHLIDKRLVLELKRLSPLGPEHMPAQISLIEAVADRFPKVPQIACFDTAFHHDLPRVARQLPIPRRYEAAGVRRYGFHGLSYEYLMEELVRAGDPAATQGRVILAHLGNGASLAAVLDGRCIDTSMGFTPAAGLMMGRRTGDLDPGLPAYIARSEGMTPEQFDRMANHESGLLGVSETTSDMQELIALQQSDVRAKEAISLFCYQAKKWVGSFAAVLGGLDTLVFAGGIGENNASIRSGMVAGLGFLGIDLDEARNAANVSIISKNTSRVSVRVIRTDEELMIARSIGRVLGLDADDSRNET